MKRAAWRDLVGVGAVAAVLLLVPDAHGHRGDGVFTLISGLAQQPSDLAMLPDGGIVLAGSEVWRLTPARERLAIPGFAATSLSVAPDGSVLGLDGGQNVIRRWTPSGGVSVVAGAGRGFGGDGGPATEARLRLGPVSGIVALPDGGFAFADTGNHRIRVVDVAGTIRTFASGLGFPTGVAATEGGGFIVTDAESGRVRQLGRDGTIDTVARLSDPGDVAVSPAHGAVIAAGDGPWRLAPGSRRAEPYLRPRRTTEPADFAARVIYPGGIASDPHGGLLVGNAYRRSIMYVPNGPTPWTLAALRDMRTSRRGVAAVIETTQPGTATLEIVRRGRVVARGVQAVAGGHASLSAAGSIRPAWHRIRVRLRGADGSRAHDALTVHGAQRLTVRLARRLLGRDQEVDEGYHAYLGRRCRAFGRRRVDCVVRVAEYDRDTCRYVASVTLGRTGVVLRRQYDCGGRKRARLRRHPRFDRFYGVVPLSPGYGGKFY